MQQQITNVLRRPFHTIPFTLTMIGLVVVSGIVSGATSGHSTAPFVARYAWSLPQIRAGHAWVIVTMIRPWADWTSNVIAMINFLIVLGVCEWLLGARITWLVYLLGHTLTMLAVTLVLLAVTRSCDTATCRQLAYATDSGTSVGVLACIGAACLRFRHGRFVAAGIVLVLLGWLLAFHVLYAIEHAIAFPIGLLLGSRLQQRFGLRPVRFGYRSAET